MALPTTYLTSIKNLPAILESIKKAQAPQRFTQKFLEGLGYTGSADRLVIGMFKSLGFLNDTGQPTQAYYQYLDDTQSKIVMAEALKKTYGDLFQVNKEANKMSNEEIKNKLKTLSQGQHSDSVLKKMAMTFKEFSRHADFSKPLSGIAKSEPEHEQEDDTSQNVVAVPTETVQSVKQKVNGIDGLVYNINIHLPESRDQAVYDALFKSINTHLL